MSDTSTDGDAQLTDYEDTTTTSVEDALGEVLGWLRCPDCGAPAEQTGNHLDCLECSRTSGPIDRQEARQG